MCTDLCPCNDGILTIPKPKNTDPLIQLYDKNFYLSGSSKYRLKKFEQPLSDASRYFKVQEDDSSKIPMKFTKNTNQGFWTFK